MNWGEGRRERGRGEHLYQNSGAGLKAQLVRNLWVKQFERFWLSWEGNNFSLDLNFFGTFLIICYTYSDQSLSGELLMTEPVSTTDPAVETATEAQPSYVKLAMRNMVKKKGVSLKHFFLTTAALLGFFVGISYLTRP